MENIGVQNPETDKGRVLLELPHDLLQDLTAQARREKVTRAKLMRRICAAYLETQKSVPPPPPLANLRSRRQAVRGN